MAAFSSWQMESQQGPPVVAREVIERIKFGPVVMLTYDSQVRRAQQKNVETTAVSATPQRTSDIILAFQTLREFKLGSRNLLVSFVSECLIEYLDDENSAIRKEAALTCSKLVAPACIKDYGDGSGQSTSSTVVAGVLQKLLNLAVTDRDSSLRATILSCLSSEFDLHLAQEDCLRLLFMTLNDESFRVR